MINDNLEFMDGYDEVEQSKVRSIRMRENSFENTLGFWDRMRLKKLQKDLEKAQDKALTKNYKLDSNGEFNSKVEKDMEKKALAVARIEEKIKFLTGEYVPEDYTRSRAIKLKENMKANLSFNSQNAYSLGLDKVDVVFNDDEEEIEANVEEVDEVVEQVEPEEAQAEEEEYEVVVPETEEYEVEEDESDNVLDRVIRENQERLAKEVQEVLEKKNNKVTDEIEVVPTDFERQQIKDAVDGMFNEVAEDVENKSDEDISAAIDAEIDKLNRENTLDVVGAEEIESTIDDAMEEIEENEMEIDTSVVDEAIDEEMNSLDEAEINYDDIKAQLDEAMGNIRVSKNGTAAKLDKFDENGQIRESEDELTEEDVRSLIDEVMNEKEEEKKYDYKPMTDEEIARARENIEYDKYEDVYRDENANRRNEVTLNVPEVKFDDIFKPTETVNYENVGSPEIDFSMEEENVVRDFPMVVPERQEIVIYSKEDEVVEEHTSDSEDLHFDYSTATAEEVNKGIDYASSLSEFDELRKRAQELKEKQRKSQEEREAAEREEEEKARRVQEKTEFADAVQKDYEKRIEKLRMYTEALAEDCNFNENKAKLAEDAAKRNEIIAQEQEAKAKSMQELIDEIDSIITPEATNVRRGK